MEENQKLKKYISDIKNALDIFEKDYYNSIDPISFLISDESRWLLTNKLKYSDKSLKNELIRSILEDINKTIKKISKDRFEIKEVNKEMDEISLFIGDKDEKLIYWEVFSGVIKIKKWDNISLLKEELKILKKKLKDKSIELEESKIILKKKETLVNNGYYVAYVKSLIRPIKFKKDSEYLLENLNIEMSNIKTSILKKEKEIKELENNSKTIKLLSVLDTSFRHFPRIKNYNDYISFKK